MLPNVFLSRRLTSIVRFGALYIVALVLLPAGCSNPGFRNENLVPAPTLEMGQNMPRKDADTEPFALTNKGRQIEENLLGRQRQVMPPD